MSSFVDDWQVAQFSANCTTMFQQKASELRGTTREQFAAGREDVWNRVAPTEAVQKVGRRVRTPQMNTPQSQRVALLQDWEYGDLIEWGDLARTLADPRSEYTVNGAKSLGRRFDRAVLSAFGSDAVGGESGGTITSFLSECAGDHDFSIAPLSVPDILELKKDLDDNDVDEIGRHIVMDQSGLKQLLSQSSAPRLNSADYNAVKALMDGSVEFFLGFQWHQSSLCPSPAPGLFYGYVWQQDAMGISISNDITTELTRRSDWCNAWEVKVFACLGATRLQGAGVSRFKIASG